MAATEHAAFVPSLFVVAALLCLHWSCLASQEVDGCFSVGQPISKQRDFSTQGHLLIQTKASTTKGEDFREGDQQLVSGRASISPRADNVDIEKGSDILILVLGYGEPERKRELGSTLNFLVEEAPAVQCIIFVWNAAAPTRGFPSQCRMISAQGAFLGFILQVPKTMLDAAKYIFLMADDLDLKHKFKPVRLLGLKTAMERFQLDIVSPAMADPVRRPIMKPSLDSSGRLVDYIDWQAQMLTKQTINALMQWLQPQITGCWGYDHFIYPILRRQNMTARIGILNTMIMVHNHPSGGVRTDAKKASACGHIGPHGEHFASDEIISYFQQHGLQKSSQISFGPLL